MVGANKTISKLEIIKELTQDKSVSQVCDVMIEYLKGIEKQGIGFQK